MSGDLRVFKHPRPGVRYCAGVDCGEGIIGRDNSAMVIGDMQGEVAVVLAGIYDQNTFAQMASDLGHEYNYAFVLNERQGAFSFQLQLWNMGYRNMYRHKDSSSHRAGYKGELGWPSSTGAKTRLISTMRSALTGDAFLCTDMETLRELTEYKRHKDGSYGAPSGSHDDRAIAAMLYLLAIEEAPTYAGVAARMLPGGRKSSVLSYPEGVFG